MESEVKKYSDISTEKKTETIAQWLIDRKGEDLLAIDLKEKSALSESIILVTASSIRHAQGLADMVLEECRKNSFEFLSMEGYAVGLWILIDLNDVVLHIFQDEKRDEYRLNDLWPNAEIIIDKREDKELV